MKFRIYFNNIYDYISIYKKSKKIMYLFHIMLWTNTRWLVNNCRVYIRHLVEHPLSWFVRYLLMVTLFLLSLSKHCERASEKKVRFCNGISYFLSSLWYSFHSTCMSIYDCVCVVVSLRTHHYNDGLQDYNAGLSFLTWILKGNI